MYWINVNYIFVFSFKMEQNSDGQMETKNKVKKETPTNVEYKGIDDIFPYNGNTDSVQKVVSDEDVESEKDYLNIRKKQSKFAIDTHKQSRDFSKNTKLDDKAETFKHGKPQFREERSKQLFPESKDNKYTSDYYHGQHTRKYMNEQENEEDGHHIDQTLVFSTAPGNQARVAGDFRLYIKLYVFLIQ